MEQKQLISVIIPIYNAQPYLEQAVRSVMEQTYRNLEILCLNDGSTDDSLATIQDLAAEDSRIQVIDKSNEGYGATCNRGLDEATGDWIAILEPDDWVEPTMYADMLQFASRLQDKPEIIKTPFFRIFMAGRKAERKLNCGYYGRIKPKHQPFPIHEATILLADHPSIWSALYSKAFLEKHHIRFPEIPGAGWADNPFLIDTLCQATKIAYLNNPYYCYREDTPEKAEAFAHSNPLLPFHRWHDMCDRLEEIGITDPEIWKAHYSRGFLYLSGVIEVVDLTHEEVFTEAVRMFDRMDPDLVFSEEMLSPGHKRLFARFRQLPEPKIDPISYMGNLVSKTLYNLRYTDIRFSVWSVAEFLKRHKKRVGQ